jgi:hypothetical protein
MIKLEEGQVKKGMTVLITTNDGIIEGVVTKLYGTKDSGFNMDTGEERPYIFSSAQWKHGCVYLLPPEVNCVHEQHNTIPTKEWTDKHYDHYYHLTPEDISAGKIRLDAYTVSKVWKIGSKDDSGALWHTFKLFPRWGEKNSVEREIKALYAQTKALAKIYNVKLEG